MLVISDTSLIWNNRGIYLIFLLKLSVTQPFSNKKDFMTDVFLETFSKFSGKLFSKTPLGVCFEKQATACSPIDSLLLLPLVYRVF